MGDSGIYAQDFTRLLPGGATGSSGISPSKIIFWIVALALNGALSYFLYSMLNRQISGVLVFMAVLFMTYFYYVKLFIVNKTVWPPITTPCPDYLTLIRTPAANGNPASQTCVDFVGVSNNGGLQKCDPKNLANCLTNPALHFNTPSSNETISTVQDRVLSAGLIWSSMFGDV
jgi:hypothetical protein